MTGVFPLELIAQPFPRIGGDQAQPARFDLQPLADRPLRLFQGDPGPGQAEKSKINFVYVFLSFRSPCTNVAAKAAKLGGGSEKLKTNFGFSLALH